MVTIEGVRRIGKSFAIDVLKKYYPNLIYHKDLGIRMIKGAGVDIDDYVIGRDLTLAQFLPKIETSNLESLIFDRQYWSSYVYGQYYRKKYNKTGWKNHILNVEQVYGIDWIEKNMHIVLLSPEADDYKRLAGMNRKKDDLEDSNIDSYIIQQELYIEILSLSRAQVHLLKPFQNEEYIISFMKRLIPDIR